MYVKIVDPEYAVVSAGRNNRYGHPHKEVSEIFTLLGVTMLRTSELGTIEFESDGKNFIKNEPFRLIRQ
jgi:competence protein ComEC